MFAADRGATHRIATAVERLSIDKIQRLSPMSIAGTDEVILASVTLRRAISNGKVEALCEEIAARMGTGRKIEVRFETLDVVDFLTSDASPLSIETLMTCVG